MHHHPHLFLFFTQEDFAMYKMYLLFVQYNDFDWAMLVTCLLKMLWR